MTTQEVSRNTNTWQILHLWKIKVPQLSTTVKNFPPKQEILGM